MAVSVAETGVAFTQARKRHININFLVRLLLGHPGNVPGTNRVCPRDKVGLSHGQTQVSFLFYTAEAQFVPGTNPVCPWDIPGTKGGRQSLCVKSLCAFFVPYLRSSRDILIPRTNTPPVPGKNGTKWREYCAITIGTKRSPT